MPHTPTYTDWPPAIAAFLDEAEAIVHLLQHEHTTLERAAPLPLKHTSEIISLVQEGLPLLLQGTTALEALETWAGTPGVVVLPNPATARERATLRLEPAAWHTTLAPLVDRMIAFQPLTAEQWATLNAAAARMERELGAICQRIDEAVRARWNDPPALVIEGILKTLDEWDRATQAAQAPEPIPPLAPWPPTWWTLETNGPTGEEEILASALERSADLMRARQGLERVRGNTAPDLGTHDLVQLVAAALDATRRLRVLQAALVFLANRTHYDWPALLPIPMDHIVTWAIAGDSLPVLEKERKVLMTTAPTREDMLACLHHLQTVLDETIFDLQDTEHLLIGEQVEGMHELAPALARLVHGAAAPPRPAMPWVAENEQARQLRGTLRAKAVAIRQSVQIGQVHKVKRKPYGSNQPTPEGQECIDTVRRAIKTRCWLLMREAVLRQVCDILEAGEQPTPEGLQPRWLARVRWAWYEMTNERLFKDAIHEAYQPLDVRMYVNGQLRCGLASVYERTAAALSDALTNASLIEQRCWQIGIDPAPWGTAARAVFDFMETAETAPQATVCCDCGQPTTDEQYQCPACERAEEQRLSGLGLDDEGDEAWAD